MKILIEGYYYDPALLEKEKVSDGLIEHHRRNKDGYVCYNYVGHVYSPELRDYIFFLPKVVLKTQTDGQSEETDSENETDLVFGEKPEDIISVTDKNNKLDVGKRNFICELAVWIYRALMVYRTTHPNQNILLERNIAQIGTQRKRLSNTLLDVILELIQFNRDNQDFVLFVLKNIHSGFNRVNWNKTISHSQAFIQQGIPVYFNPVNKKRQINYDEELFIIYFSILNYVFDHYGFPVYINLGFELITGSRFKHYLDGYGQLRLRQIRYKYFSDKALRLWELCYAFFDKSHNINVHDDQKEYLLAQNFNIVFEAMIDKLVGSRDLPSDLTEQKDGKRVDHMYTYADLVYPNSTQKQAQKEIYYIGDSKYYKIGSSIGEESVYKQYTYARNVIQWNLDLFLSGDTDKQKKDNPKQIWLRDETTEGYNIIPNFFISAFVDEQLHYEKDNLQKRDTIFKTRQFENRLFDRDTLLISHYDVNFLYVLSLYARNRSQQQEAWKTKVRAEFRNAIQKILEERYHFYALAPKPSTYAKGFIRDNLKDLLGKIYAPFDNTEMYLLALDNTIPSNDSDTLLAKIGEYFYMTDKDDYKIGDDPTESLEKKGYKQGASMEVNPNDLALFAVAEGPRFDGIVARVKQMRKLGIALQNEGAVLHLVEGFTRAHYLVIHNKSDKQKGFMLESVGPLLVPGTNIGEIPTTKKDADLYLVYSVLSADVHMPELNLSLVTRGGNGYNPQLHLLSELIKKINFTDNV